NVPEELPGQAIRRSAESQPDMGGRVGVSDIEPRVRQTGSGRIFGEREHRLADHIILEVARAVQLDEEPFTARRVASPRLTGQRLRHAIPGCGEGGPFDTR